MSELNYNDILKAQKALKEAAPDSPQSMMINDELQKSLSDVIGMIELLGEGKLEVWYGDTKVTLTMKITEAGAPKKGKP